MPSIYLENKGRGVSFNESIGTSVACTSAMIKPKIKINNISCAEKKRSLKLINADTNKKYSAANTENCKANTCLKREKTVSQSQFTKTLPARTNINDQQNGTGNCAGIKCDLKRAKSVDMTKVRTNKSNTISRTVSLERRKPTPLNNKENVKQQAPTKNNISYLQHRQRILNATPKVETFAKPAPRPISKLIARRHRASSMPPVGILTHSGPQFRVTTTSSWPPAARPPTITGGFRRFTIDAKPYVAEETAASPSLLVMQRFTIDAKPYVAEETAASLLASRGASTFTPHHVNLQDRSGKTLLIHSCAKGCVSTVEELSNDENIDVNLADNEGNTALHHAAQAGQHNVLRVLIERFANLQIDQLNKLGQTALIKSTIQGRVNCAKLLLEAGADPYLRDHGRQFCALEWAEYVGRTECAHMIAHFMLDSAPPENSPNANDDSDSLKKRSVQRCRSPIPNTFVAAVTKHSRFIPGKKFSDTAGNNFKQVACLAAIPLIGGVVSGELPAVVRPRVRSAPPIPTFKITSPQQTCSQSSNGNNSSKRFLRSRQSNRKSSKSPLGITVNHGTPLVATVVAHCRIRPSSSCS